MEQSGPFTATEAAALQRLQHKWAPRLRDPPLLAFDGALATAPPSSPRLMLSPSVGGFVRQLYERQRALAAAARAAAARARWPTTSGPVAGSSPTRCRRGGSANRGNRRQPDGSPGKENRWTRPCPRLPRCWSFSRGTASHRPAPSRWLPSP